MIIFETNKDNDEYYVIDAKLAVGSMITSKRIPVEIKKEAEVMYNSMFVYEKRENIGYIDELAIRKDSKIGQYLENIEDNEEVYNGDYYIDYKKIVNAFNIATFEDNPIALELVELFKKQISGKKSDLEKLYSPAVLDYILNHTDYYKYIDKLNGTYEPQEYFVYEDGEISKKILSKIDSKQKRIIKK